MKRDEYRQKTVLRRIGDLTDGEEFALVTYGELSGGLSPEWNMTKEELSATVRTFERLGYLEIRYCDGVHYCLRLTKEGRLQRENEQMLVRMMVDLKKEVFVAAFLAAFIASGAVLLLGLLL